MEKNELIQYAKEKANEGVDLFALLGVDATTSPEDIHKAWRRTALKHYPDKARAPPTMRPCTNLSAAPAMFSSTQRPAMPTTRSSPAALQKKQQLEQMSSRRRQLVEDLERREQEARDAKKARTEQTGS